MKPPRKPARPITAKYLQNAAAFYLERYPSTAEGLRRVLDERRPRPNAFRLREIAPGNGGFQPEFADGDWQRIRDAIYEGRGT